MPKSSAPCSSPSRKASHRSSELLRTITDTDLVEFCKWYADFHGDTDIETSVIVTCLCGYFHTFPKAADKFLMRCKKLRLIVANGDKWNMQVGGARFIGVIESR